MVEYIGTKSEMASNRRESSAGSLTETPEGVVHASRDQVAAAVIGCPTCAAPCAVEVEGGLVVGAEEGASGLEGAAEDGGVGVGEVEEGGAVAGEGGGEGMDGAAVGGGRGAIVGRQVVEAHPGESPAAASGGGRWGGGRHEHGSGRSSWWLLFRHLRLPPLHSV